MSNEFYDDLSQALHKSLSQALNIAKGETEPSRIFSYEMPDIKAIRAKAKLGARHTTPNGRNDYVNAITRKTA